MRHLFLTGAAGAAMLATSLITAQAMPVGPAPEGLAPVENVAICFYADGWHGPGMYQCGYRLRKGHGWVGERRREERREERRREERREDRRDRR